MFVRNFIIVYTHHVLLWSTMCGWGTKFICEEQPAMTKRILYSLWAPCLFEEQSVLVKSIWCTWGAPCDVEEHPVIMRRIHFDDEHPVLSRSTLYILNPVLLRSTLYSLWAPCIVDEESVVEKHRMLVSKTMCWWASCIYLEHHVLLRSNVCCW